MTELYLFGNPGVSDGQDYTIQGYTVLLSLSTAYFLLSAITLRWIKKANDGEKIRLLPLCGHAYHTECIHPWLTERQGCCPYCKSPVINQKVGLILAGVK